MKLVVITIDYPDSRRNVFPFVKALVEALADRGNECAVIAPYSVSHNKRFYKYISKEKTAGNNYVTVIRPSYVSFSKFKIGNVRITDRLHALAVRRGLRKVPFKPDAIYGHFWPSAFEGYDYSKRHNIPLFVATGESVISDTFSFNKAVEPFCNSVKGVICVSSKNKEESLKMGLTTADKCVVIPNAVDTTTFRLLDRAECRRKLNISQDAFLVSFVGWFNNRKGVLRVSDAIKKTKDSAIYSIFIGSGDLDPDCDGIVFKGAVAHEDIPIYLNASDVFVLPTLQEGCCNAIVEALSCGLPVISSDRSFNWDILDESNALLVDPENVEQISLAIERLHTDEKMRKQLAEGALKKAEMLSMRNRAERIESFIKNKILGDV